MGRVLAPVPAGALRAERKRQGWAPRGSRLLLREGPKVGCRWQRDAPSTQLHASHEAMPKGIAVTLTGMKFWCVSPLTLQKPRPR